jgi:pimeloyl-ACP methyl ester carboxylesterase
LVSEGYTFLAFDLRGRGNSSKPAAGYSIVTHSDDVKGLMDNFNIQKYVHLLAMVLSGTVLLGHF